LKQVSEKTVLCRAECPSGWPDGDAVGCDMNYAHPSQIMDEIAGFSFARLDELGSIQWPCTAAAPEGTPIMHLDGFARSRGKFVGTDMSRPRREQRPDRILRIRQSDTGSTSGAHNHPQ